MSTASLAMVSILKKYLLRSFREPESQMQSSKESHLAREPLVPDPCSNLNDEYVLL